MSSWGPYFPWEVPGRAVAPEHLPLTSIVLPVYNQRKYVAGAVHSVLAELKMPFELIIVNDGSSDGVEEDLRKLALDQRVRVIHQDNQGLPRALNRGFADASGAFLTWTSADNRYLPDGLLSLARYLIANPSVGLAYGDVFLVDESGERARNSEYRKIDQDPEDRSRLRLPCWSDTLLEFHDNFINAGFLFRRTVLEEAGLHNPECRLFEDFDLWMRMAQLARVAHVDSRTPCYEYRLHPESLTAKLDGEELMEDVRRLQHRNRKTRAELGGRLVLAASGSAGGKEGELRGVLGAEGLTPAEWNRGESALKLELTNTSFSGATLVVEPEEKDALPAFTFDRFLWNGIAPAARVRGFRDKESRESVSSFLFQPVRMPPLLRRARDTSFNAFEPTEGTTMTFLVLVPDGNDNYAREVGQGVTELAGAMRDTMFVLFCETAEQRNIANLVNLSLENNGNLRILDYSADYAACKESGSWQRCDETLLYLLSTADAVLTFMPRMPLFLALTSLRTQFGLAASAGRQVLCVDEGWPPLTFKERDTAVVRLRTELRTAPYVRFYTRAEILPDRARGLRNRMSSDVIYPGSYEQWLERLSPEAMAEKIRALFLSVALAPRG